MIPSHLTGKGKGDNLIRGKYRGPKLLDHALKGIERVMEKIIWERAFISDMKFDFIPSLDTIDVTFILRQLPEKHLANNRKLNVAFVDLERAFDRVRKNFIWCHAKTWR